MAERVQVLSLKDEKGSAKMGKKESNEFWAGFGKTLTEGASESGSAIWGLLGQDVKSDRDMQSEQIQAELEKERIKADAAKDAALYAALSGNSANSGVSGIVNRGKPSAPMTGPGMSFRLKKIAKGAIAGGAAGFVTGSVLPVIGNMAGLVGGAILGGFAADSLE